MADINLELRFLGYYLKSERSLARPDVSPLCSISGCPAQSEKPNLLGSCPVYRHSFKPKRNSWRRSIIIVEKRNIALTARPFENLPNTRAERSVGGNEIIRQQYSERRRCTKQHCRQKILLAIETVSYTHLTLPTNREV